jgi:hypothetical protein
VQTEITIPLLPCHAINPMLEFYRLLGFEVTYQQSKPNNYAVVQRGGIELHFFSMRDYLPANSYSTCYVRVPDVDTLYEVFRVGLRSHYGRVPSAGIPRVIPLKNKAYGVREFIVVDPGGNWIRIGQAVEESIPDERPPQSASKLAKATHAAGLLERVGHYDRAIAMLDPALEAGGEPAERVPALALRLSLAINQDDRVRALQTLQSIRELALSPEERDSLAEHFEHIDELELTLQALV